MINFLFVLAVLVLLVAPIVIEAIIFKKDENKGVSCRRFKTVLFTLVYFIGMTVALFFLKEIILWIESLSFVEWIAKKAAINDQVTYFVKVLVAILVNVAIGALFILLTRFTRIGMKKSLLIPKKNKKFSLGQRLETKIITFFHKEIWFFVGRILKYLSLALSAVYAVVFVLYLLPALSDAWWIPHGFISMLFSAGYIYPMLTLLVLWEAYFFLAGVENVEKECPELLKEKEPEVATKEDNLNRLDEEVRNKFGKFYVSNVDVSRECQPEICSAEHHKFTQIVAEAIENDKRNPQSSKEAYLNCIDKLCETDKSAIINGTFFSEFSMYFLRYLSVILARGDNIVFVCNNDEQIEEVYNYVKEGFSEIYSLFCNGFKLDNIDFDDPIWKIVKVSGERDVIEKAYVNDCSILVTTLAYLTSSEFEKGNSNFIHLLDTVVFVDTLKTVNTYNRQLSMLNAKLTNITKNNALDSKNKNKNKKFKVRYMSRQIRYICFDDTRVAALDKVLKNMFGLDFESLDSMRYNESTILRCYNYEAGTRSKLDDIDETIGIVMNTAVVCASKNVISNVNVFASETLPYATIKEIIAANAARLPAELEKRPILINKQLYNPDEYSVIIVVDEANNLPRTLRRYVSMASDKPTLIYVFSRPYMLRDYYVANIDALWNRQIERIPIEVTGNKGFARSILVKADAGGIPEEEIFRLAANNPKFEDLAAKRDINAILRAVLEIYGLNQKDRIDLYKHFEFSTTRDFDENGNYRTENRVHLRQRGQLSDMINGRGMITMVTSKKAEIQLSLPKSRLTQNYIAGQNILHNGEIYTIESIDLEHGRIYTSMSSGAKNEDPYEYIQKREYRIEIESERMEPLFSTKSITLNQSEEDIGVSKIQISAFRAPMEVLTNGYYIIDPHTCTIDTTGYHEINKLDDDKLAKQTYRRYGTLLEATYLSEKLIQATGAATKENGAVMMSIRMRGQFGPDVNKVMALAATMLNELIHSMFPSVADSVAVVCPALDSQFLNDDDSKHVFRTQPKGSVRTYNENDKLWDDGDFILMIVEDCATDLGVVSALMSSGDDILDTLFDPITEYLKWYLESNEKSEYLYYGLDHEPSCFDFNSLYKLAKLLGDEKCEYDIVDIDTIMEYESCDFCEKSYTKGGRDIDQLEDSRRMCKACASKIVGNNKKALESHLSKAKIFLESTYGIVLDDYDVIFEPTVKIVNTLKQNRNLVGRGSDMPLKSYVDDKKRIHVESEIPSVNLSELLVRELTHVWQMKHLPEISEEMAEGQIALVTIQYLKSINNIRLANARKNYYESTSNISGEGYRRLVRDLLSNTQFRNNPFRYLIEDKGMGSEDALVVPEPREIEIGDDETPYTPDTPDRAMCGNTYFYYTRLSASQQRAYDAMLEAIQNFAPSVTLDGCSIDDASKVNYAIAFDHPELFWYQSNIGLSMHGSDLTLCYGVSREEASDIQSRIDAAIPQYMEGITENMSAYDVALRLYAKIISTVDYDTIALNRETRGGGPAKDETDYLRTICGVFLNGKAVCEGYARALQYLLQKCGVECAEVAGYILDENGNRGGGHAWNIVKIDGDYYFMDATWDDSSDTVQTVKSNDVGFDFFCVTSQELLKTRDCDLSPVAIPECTALKGNYYYHNKLVIDSYDLNKIKAIAVAAAEKDKKSFCFKCKTEAVFNEALRRLFIEGDDGFDVVKAAAKVNKSINSSTYSHGNKPKMLTITVHFKQK